MTTDESRTQAREEALEAVSAAVNGVMRSELGQRAAKGLVAPHVDAILAPEVFDRLAGLLGYVKTDEVRAARLSALSNAADVVHAEARWQWELDSRGHIGAQTVAQRMQVVEACLRAFAGEKVADADTQ